MHGWLPRTALAWALVASGCATTHEGTSTNLHGLTPTQPSAPALVGEREVDRLRHHIFDNLALTAGMRVAELGAGSGWFTFRIAEAIGKEGRVYSTDIDSKAIAALEAGVQRATPNAATVTPLLCKTPRDTALDHLPDATIDLILIVDSVCTYDLSGEMAVRVGYLKRLHRILAPEGRLVYHPDCACGGNDAADTSSVAFYQAGFVHSDEFPPLPPRSEPADPEFRCTTGRQLERHQNIDVYRKRVPSVAP